MLVRFVAIATLLATSSAIFVAGPSPAVVALTDSVNTVVVCGRSAVPVDEATATSDLVTPPVLTGDAPASAISEEIRAAANDALRHLLLMRAATGWARNESAYLSSAALRNTAEGTIRLPAADAYSIAVMLATDGYRASEAGRDERYAKAFAIWLLRSVACAHAVNGGPGWKTSWAQASWAGLIGAAAWMLWPDLRLADRYAIVRVVEKEADDAAVAPALYYARADGTVVRPGDTAIEEMSWCSELLWLATAMFPGHPHEASWATGGTRAALAALSMPADPSLTEVVNGREVRDWVSGSNVLANGFVVNHARLHPQYSALLTRAMQPTRVLTLAGRPVPDAVFHNADIVYGALSTESFSSPPYLEPGGTVYKVGSGDVYLPAGSDWGPRWPINMAVMDTEAATLGFDARASGTAREWQALHVAEQRLMQARAFDGRTRQLVSEYSYRGAESNALQYLATMWWSEWMAANRTVTRTSADLANGTLPPVVGAPTPPPVPPIALAPGRATLGPAGKVSVADPVDDAVALVGRRDRRGDIIAIGRTRATERIWLSVRPSQRAAVGEGELSVTWFIRLHIPGPVSLVVTAQLGGSTAPVIRVRDGAHPCDADVRQVDGRIEIGLPRSCLGTPTWEASAVLDFTANTGANTHDASAILR